MHFTLLALTLMSQSPSVPTNPEKAYSIFVSKVQAFTEKKDLSGLRAVRSAAKDPFQQIVANAYAYSIGDSSAKEPLLHALGAGHKWLAIIPATEGNGAGLVWPVVWDVITEIAKQGEPRAIRGMFAMANVADGAASEGMSGAIGEFLSKKPALVIQNWSMIHEFSNALSAGYEFGIPAASLPKLRKEYSRGFSSQPKFRDEILSLLSSPRE